MEKISEITTSNYSLNAFEVIMKCKELAFAVDLANVICDNTSIDEKEMLIQIIEGVRSLELEVIGVESFTPEAKA
tara:strand:- start:92 stop:316 length:225 start_codon:yes stop_codon:yes gene_type:complete